MDSPDRIRSITKQYCSLQGLRFTPFWLILVLRPWGDVLPNHRPTFIRDYLTMAMFLFSVIWIWLSGRYYRRRFGRVESKPQPWWAWLFAVAFIAAYFVCWFADEKNPPVSFVAVWWGCLLGVQALYFVSLGARRFYYGVAAVCMLALALLPSTGWITASRMFSAYHPSASFILGLVMTALGVLDHFQLVRMFEHPLESTNA
jgi:drug/metabolite transporter (DMT)-like permease